MRGWLARRREENRRTYAQRLGEERIAGEERWVQLYRRREEEELVNGARTEDLEENLELHQVCVEWGFWDQTDGLETGMGGGGGA